MDRGRCGLIESASVEAVAQRILAEDHAFHALFMLERWQRFMFGTLWNGMEHISFVHMLCAAAPKHMLKFPKAIIEQPYSQFIKRKSYVYMFLLFVCGKRALRARMIFFLF